MTKREACQKWVRGFNAISQDLLERAFKDNIDDIIELTEPTIHDRCWSSELQCEVEIVKIDRDKEIATVVTDDSNKKIKIELNDLSVDYDNWLPMWGALWTFDERCDEDWVRDNIGKASDCGVRIYEDQTNGDIYIGIDGAGYDFYKEHWIPLYDAMGFKWHDEEGE